VTDHHFKTELVGQTLLELVLPQPEPITIAAAAITQDQQLSLVGERRPVWLLPPVDNGLDRKLSGISRGPDINVTKIMLHVVDAVGNGSTEGITRKIRDGFSGCEIDEIFAD
jgi:hypothetical protein